MSQPLQTQGRVRVAFPDRFRWELGQPPQTIAIRAPDHLLLVYPRLKRAERYPLTSRPGPWRDALALIEAGFPRDRAELERRFRIESLELAPDGWRLGLSPRTAGARRFMREIAVTLATNDFALVATEVAFVDGSRLRNDFSDAASNLPLEDALFAPALGADTTLVEPTRP